MRIASVKQSFLSLAIATLFFAVASITSCHAEAPPAQAAAPSIALQPYTASDQSASAGVPSGWKVTNAQQTVITMSGPQGEMLTMGNTFVAQNAAFVPGQRGANGIDLSMPYSSTLAQKLTMIMQQNAAIAGKPAPQVTINSSTPVQLPPALGQCGKFVASTANDQGPVKLMALICSLPLDSGGAYKNIIVMATAPAAVAAQSAPTAQAVFRTYQIPQAWLQKKLAPHNAPPPAMAKASGGNASSAAAQAAAINHETMVEMQGADNSANCFSLALRETPAYELPRSCGGTKPD